MNKAILDLIELSKYAAKHPDFVQGGGGNCSVKFSKKMFIKASGYFLEDVSPKDGLVILDLLKKKPLSNQKHHPSLETSLHYLLGAYVIHTHPIVVGALVCAKEGRKIFKDIFNKQTYYWINFTNPGEQLSKEVCKLLVSENINLKKCFALFLENHGVFISGPTKNSCIELHEKIINKLERFFKSKEINFNLEKTNISRNKYLTPDHIVYFNINKHELKDKSKVAINEMEVFVNKVILLIKLNGMRIKYLAKKDCDFILNMKEEKYRKKIYLSYAN